jgi:excisionase family DNA binding protein
MNTYLDELKTVTQTADVLDVARMTIYRWIEDKKIACEIIGGIFFIHQSEINRLLSRTCNTCRYQIDNHCECRESTDIQKYNCGDWKLKV